MLAKVKATGEIIDVLPCGPQTSIWGNTKRNELYNKWELEFEPFAPEKAVIEGWIARDSKEASNSLYFYRNEVKRGRFYWIFKDSSRPMGESLILPDNLFPSITWESEPQRVKIEITLIDEKQ